MAYTTSEGKRRQTRESVLSKIAQRARFSSSGRSMYAVGSVQVHTRYCAGTGKYKFNINPNTLRADYELWICGSEEDWYLVPIRVIRAMYDHPNAYPDRLHPEIRVVSVDTSDHSAIYASPSIKQDLRPYHRAVLTV